MTRFFRDRTGSVFAIASAAVVVVAFAVLQYRWNREASTATGVRLADSLQLSMINWHLDLFHNLSEICLAMRAGSDQPVGGSLQPHADRFAEWRSIARYPDLVSELYVVRGPSAPKQAFRLTADRRTFERVSLPDSVAASSFDRAARGGEAGPAYVGPGSTVAEPYYSIGAALRDWHFDPAVPALVRAPSLARSSAEEGIVLVLNREVLEHRVLPDLARRYFQGTDGLDYEVAVVAGESGRDVIYSSDPGFATGRVADADGRMDLFGRPLERTSPSALYVFQPTSDGLRPTAAVGVTWFALVDETPSGEDWQLVVRHRRGGSLGAFVASIRRRGLAVSFGALLLLVASMSMLIVVSRRAQRLARLQMDFVTAVSHELRTPLTIIGSAADNIAAGVLENKAQLQEYGGVIGHQVGQLSGLVERILLFAAMREGRQQYSMQALSVPAVIDAVLASTGGLIRAGQFTVERDVDPRLPLVTGDNVAIAQCLENLITNALKYGKSERWIGVRARAVIDGRGVTDVQISVSDRGIGIEPSDLPHVFEPFYRKSSVGAAQIHGTGLGLALSRQIADAMGGSIDVTSVPGRGSTFTLHLFTSPLQPT